MTTNPARAKLIGQIIYPLVISALLLAHLLALGASVPVLPRPDWALALTFAWVLRRPEQVSVVMVALMFLVWDVMTHAPLGLSAAFAVLGSEILRQRVWSWRDQNFAVEWLKLGGLVLLLKLGERAIMALFFVDGPAVGKVMLEALATIAIYPVVVGLARMLLGLRRLSADEIERLN